MSKKLHLNAENLLHLEQSYLNCCPNGELVFYQRRRKALGEWKNLVNQQPWDNVRNIDDVYEILEQLSRQVRGVTRERILSTAAEIAYKCGLSADETYEYMRKHRLYVRQIADNQKLQEISILHGWQLIGFLCYYQNRLTKMQREHN